MDNLSWKQIMRIVTLTVITLFLILCTLWYSWGMYDIMEELSVDDADKIMIDGADFTSIINLFVYFTKGLFSLIIIVIYAGMLAVINILLLVPWRLICIRKHSIVSSIEFKVARFLLIGFSVCSVLGGVLVSHITWYFGVCILTCISVIFIWLMAFRPLKKRFEEHFHQI